MSGSEITHSDVMVAIDAAILSLHQARRMVEAYQAAPTTSDGVCKHQRVRQTYGGAACMDCGADLVPVSPTPDHGASPETEQPTSP